ncbi:MAG: DUF423 domain-containing protein [Candidatus Eisenbacteria bacterium]
MERIFFGLGCLSAGIGVAMGAFGAHAWKERLGPVLGATFETAARYQLIHALALLAVGLALASGRFGPQARLVASGWLFVAGTVLFCGSLYLLSMTGSRWLGAITPLGGLCFLAGWAILAWSALSGGAPSR